MVAGRSIRIGVGQAPARGPTPPILPNGDFLSAAAPPTLGSGVSISGGQANCTSAGQIVTWTGVLAVGRNYRVKLDALCTSGSKLRVNNSASNGANTQDIVSLVVDSALHQVSFLTFTATSADLSIEADTAVFSGWLDNIVAVDCPTVGILPDGDFFGYGSKPTLGSGVTIANGIATGSGLTTIATWTSVLTIGQSYNVSVDYNCSSGANLRANNSASNGAAIMDTKAVTADSVRRTITFATFVATGTDFSIEADGAPYTGSIDNAVATLAATSHATTGVLTGPGSAVVGTAVYNAVHPTSGTLTGAGSTVVGSSARTREHAASGILTGPGTALAGVAVYNAKHTTSGTLIGAGSTVVGSAARFRAFAATGALTGQGSTLSGAAVYNAKHTTSGTLTGQLGSIVGAATRFRALATTGALVGQGSAIAGSADHVSGITSHVTSGSLIGQASVLAGTAARTRDHVTSGILTGALSIIAGYAARWRDHDSSGVLLGVTSVVYGRVFNGTPQIHDIPVDGENIVNEPAPPTEGLGSISEPSGQIVNAPTYPAA